MLNAVITRVGVADAVPNRIKWLSENGPAYISHEKSAFAKRLGLEIFRPPYRSPESNGMLESFVKTFERDFVDMYGASDQVTAVEQIQTWFDDYNENQVEDAVALEFMIQENRLKGCPG